MKNNFVLFLLAFTSVNSFSNTNESIETFQPDKAHEVLLAATAGAFRFSENHVSFGLRAGYNHTTSPHIQLGGFPSFSVSSFSGNTGYFLGLAVGPTFNLSQDLGDTFFLRTTAGIDYTNNNNESDASFNLEASVGKRFRLSEALYYVPSLSASKWLESNSTVQFAVNIIAFSALF